MKIRFLSKKEILILIGLLSMLLIITQNFNDNCLNKVQEIQLDISQKDSQKTRALVSSYSANIIYLIENMSTISEQYADTTTYKYYDKEAKYISDYLNEELEKKNPEIENLKNSLFTKSEDCRNYSFGTKMMSLMIILIDLFLIAYYDKSE